MGMFSGRFFKSVNGESLKQEELSLPKSEKPVSVAITDELIALLKAGDVRQFNSKRPNGAIILSGLELNRISLDGIDLSCAELDSCSFEGTSFNNANFDQLRANRCFFHRTQFNNAILVGSNFSLCEFTMASFQGSDCSNSEFNISNISQCNFDETQLSEANFYNSEVQESHFKNAVMKGACMIMCYMSNSSFHHADLFDASFYQSQGENVNYSQANLEKCDFSQASLQAASSFKGAYVCDTAGLDEDTVEEYERVREEYVAVDQVPRDQFPEKKRVVSRANLIDGIPGTDARLYHDALKELDSLVGLQNVKHYIQDLLAFTRVNRMRVQLDLPKLDQTLHFVFTGNPGVGKTSVARIVAKLLNAMGCLSKGHLVEVDKSDLVGNFLGETPNKTKACVESALGGILFIDEAYNLTPINDHDMYGQEAISTLIKMMEDNRGDLSVIVAGYPDDMNRFLESNSGLSSRFSQHVEFRDYHLGELTEIFKHQLQEAKFKIEPQILIAANILFAVGNSEDHRKFGNARGVRNCFEKVVMNQARRIALKGKVTPEILTTLTVEDLPFEQWTGSPFSDFEGLLGDLSWVRDDGSTLGVKDTTTEQSFPRLSDDSIEFIRTL